MVILGTEVNRTWSSESQCCPRRSDYFPRFFTPLSMSLSIVWDSQIFILGSFATVIVSHDILLLVSISPARHRHASNSYPRYRVLTIPLILSFLYSSLGGFLPGSFPLGGFSLTFTRLTFIYSTNVLNPSSLCLSPHACLLQSPSSYLWHLTRLYLSAERPRALQCEHWASPSHGQALV
jgi:hypothetical protein